MLFLLGFFSLRNKFRLIRRRSLACHHCHSAVALGATFPGLRRGRVASDLLAEPLETVGISQHFCSVPDGTSTLH